MVENYDIFDFELSEDNMNAIATLDKKASFFDHSGSEVVKKIEQSKTRHLADQLIRALCSHRQVRNQTCLFDRFLRISSKVRRGRMSFREA